MVIYHESITYPYEFPVGMSYEDKFRICYHREPTEEEKKEKRKKRYLSEHRVHDA